MAAGPGRVRSYSLDTGASAPTRRLFGGSPASLGGGPIVEGRSGPILQRDALQRRSLAAADVLSVAIVLGAQALIFGTHRVHPFVLLALPAVVLLSKVVGLYDRDEYLLHKTTLDEAPALFQMSAMYVLLLWLGGGVFVSGSLGQRQVVGLWLLLFVCLMSFRALARAAIHRLASPERVLVIGGASAARKLEEKFERSFTVNAVIVGRVPLGRGRGEYVDRYALG